MKRYFLGGGTGRADRQSVWWLLLVLVLMLVAPLQPVAAHALVIESQPPARGQVAAGPVTVDLKFNSRLDRKRARLRVIDAQGAASDLTIQDDGSVEHLRATTGTLSAGDYRIEWYVLSPDGHVTRGNVPFTVLATP
ncbi:MAG: copper resistance protein CopC [Gammaproteobacteria bacterium]|nr:copper resistance protein CopC [Gammaproteobacteria bacterium]